jgi:hypothetical protein
MERLLTPAPQVSSTGGGHEFQLLAARVLAGRLGTQES